MGLIVLEGGREGVFGENSTARQRWLIVGVVVGIGVAAFLLGVNQEHFLTCQEFTISGNSEPPGCVQAPG